MEITHIRHVGIFSPNLAEHVRFYSVVWNLDVVAEESDAVYLRGSSAEHHLLSVHGAGRRGLHHMAFGMRDPRAVDRAAEELRSRGIRLVNEPRSLEEPGGGYGLRFVDPEGRCIELSAGVTEHGGSWAKRNVNPSSICHVVLNTTDIDKATELYTRLGFRISDWSEHQMVFLRCNPKHHVISFNQAPHASLNHVAYLVANVDEVMRGIANLRKHGVEPSWGPGRHGPGNNVFCYFKDPIGYVTEYTADIDYIKDESRHEPKVWPRTPETIDRWGISAPPSAEIRRAMTGEPDPGWV